MTVDVKKDITKINLIDGSKMSLLFELITNNMQVEFEIAGINERIEANSSVNRPAPTVVRWTTSCLNSSTAANF